MATVGRGILAGIAGTAVMTAFQKFIEMHISQREEIQAPAMFAQKVLPVHPRSELERYRLSYVAHFGLGMMWGASYGLAARAGLRGKNVRPHLRRPKATVAALRPRRSRRS